MSDNRPFSQIYLEAAEEWADLEAAADLLENMKSVSMAQHCKQLGDIPVNRAEQMVKASAEWQEYIEATNEARKKANLAKVRLEAIRMQYSEWQNSQANQRAEMRL